MAAVRRHCCFCPALRLCWQTCPRKAGAECPLLAFSQGSWPAAAVLFVVAPWPVCVCVRAVVQLCSCRARTVALYSAGSEGRGGEGAVRLFESRRIFGDLRSLQGCARHLPRRVLGPSPSLPLPSPAPSPLPPDDLGLAHNDRSAQILMCSLECEFRKYCMCFCDCVNATPKDLQQ